MAVWSAARQTGELLILLGLFMAVPTLYAAIIRDPAAWTLLLSAVLCAGVGLLLSGPFRWLRKSPGTRGFRSAFSSAALSSSALSGSALSGSALSGSALSGSATPGAAVSVPRALGAVTVGWLSVAVAGGLPFLLSKTLHWSDALFEGVSAFTTTGATSLVTVQVLTPALVVWRSLLQWLGGMGIIVLFLSVFPRIGVTGLAQFRAEVPGPAPAKALPRLSSSSKLLWVIYMALTAAAFLSLWVAGLSPFDALNYALAAVSTGGFSTVDAGPASFGNTVQWVLVIFMFLGGTNFVLQYRLFRFGDWRALTKDGEFPVYAGLQLAVGGLIALSLWLQAGWAPGAAWQAGVFQAVSTLTTTGYVSGNYASWPPLSQALIFVLLFVGGSAGSTSGGPKVVRLLVALKHAANQLRLLLHPRSVRAMRLAGKPVPERISGLVFGFLTLYAAVWFAGILGLTALGMDLADAPAASVAALSNIGTAFGATGPGTNYAAFSAATKLLLALLMIIGRLELLSILVVLHPSFWTALLRRS